MAKAKLNPLVQQLSGRVGGLVFKQTAHGTIISPKGETPRKWSAKQKAQRRRLTVEAKLFYRREMADPVKAAHYRSRARQEKIPVSAFVMGGFMKHGPRFAELEQAGGPPGGQADGRDGMDAE
jgi:hypothetical protein